MVPLSKFRPGKGKWSYDCLSAPVLETEAVREFEFDGGEIHFRDLVKFAVKYARVTDVTCEIYFRWAIDRCGIDSFDVDTIFKMIDRNMIGVDQILWLTNCHSRSLYSLFKKLAMYSDNDTIRGIAIAWLMILWYTKYQPEGKASAYLSAERWATFLSAGRGHLALVYASVSMIDRDWSIHVKDSKDTSDTIYKQVFYDKDHDYKPILRGVIPFMFQVNSFDFFEDGKVKSSGRDGKRLADDERLVSVIERMEKRLEQVYLLASDGMTKLSGCDKVSSDRRVESRKKEHDVEEGAEEGEGEGVREEGAGEGEGFE